MIGDKVVSVTQRDNLVFYDDNGIKIETQLSNSLLKLLTEKKVPVTDAY